MEEPHCFSQLAVKLRGISRISFYFVVFFQFINSFFIKSGTKKLVYGKILSYFEKLKLLEYKPLASLCFHQ